MRISLINSSDWTHLSCDVLAATCPRWSGRPFFLLPQSCDLALLEDGAEALHVARHHGQRDVALEAVDAVIGTDVQAMGRDRNTTRATLGQSLSVSAFPLYVPV